MKKGKLIALEGIDGVGKTTISRLLVSALNKSGIFAVRFEDSERKNKGYNILKPFINASVPLEAKFLFYLSSAIYKSHLIADLLADNKWVVCDRYIYSTLAHHQARNYKIIRLVEIKKIPILWPDYYFLLTVPDPIRFKRLKRRRHNTESDFIKNTPSRLAGKTEACLRSYHPREIKNTKSAQETVVEILGLLKR